MIQVTVFDSPFKYLKRIATSGSLAGAIYLLALVAFNGFKLKKTLQYIASGWYGDEAFKSGLKYVLLGLVFHFIICFIFAAIYYWLFPKVKWFQQHTIWASIAFGIVVWGIMSMGVLQMTQVKLPELGWFKIGLNLAMTIMFFSLPIAIITHTFLFKAEKKSTQKIVNSLA